MKEMKYIFGSVPSRRMGLSLGVSPIPKKTCNYACTYCQLGKTYNLANTRQMFYPVQDIIAEFEETIANSPNFDVVTIVGEGEPTLYLGLGDLISEIKKRTDKPVAVITNAALLYDENVQLELSKADIVLPSMDAYDNTTYRKINRPYGKLNYDEVYKGLVTFSEKYEGQLWLEIMLIDEVNDDEEALNNYAKLLNNIKYDRLYLNTPVRPPAESYVKEINSEKMLYAVEKLGGISIDLLKSLGFQSEIKDDLKAILSIIKRHPMNQFEIEEFLKSRECTNIDEIISDLKKDEQVDVIDYKGYITYRLK
ncbi:Wyosine [tRNA(Phe)-imidazoG37] synthetase, radical SAM superfamily [Desulfonispora thiosulfatigenes DSM 11270]|uniref:Wyosine [tRNA(Phe)-imidazoG37] synthetase, radical SAM superfamily n=1 Tax=Desulfonispora thiosulfatigenes DSM 11270 TaxID=656914 RepID=A0A1W1UEW0_DESTI|nr:radical SAM protein [Desulfonispora thiosulfatigenes]SMB79341.1 Wyosine [tRNA(Phe)-imidazoG37] synthetase, radical SAM superfamily [Desulfonispora thiosulfatigenes DSM 11270]